MTAATASARRIYNPVQKDYATFLETAAESGGGWTLIEVELAPGGGNAPHRHLTYAEHFEIVEGQVAIRLEEDVRHLEVGDKATAPAGSAHCFANLTDHPARFRVMLEPGHRGFEEALQVAYGLAEEGRVHPDSRPMSLMTSALLMEWSEIRPVGPLQAIVPVMRPLAARARRRGLDQELRRRYVRV
jgi:mannose-6-phosphate isomerase-like protein (cupin superfamily)